MADLYSKLIHIQVESFSYQDQSDVLKVRHPKSSALLSFWVPWNKNPFENPWVGYKMQSLCNITSIRAFIAIFWDKLFIVVQKSSLKRVFETFFWDVVYKEETDCHDFYFFLVVCNPTNAWSLNADKRWLLLQQKEFCLPFTIAVLYENISFWRRVLI